MLPGSTLAFLGGRNWEVVTFCRSDVDYWNLLLMLLTRRLMLAGSGHVLNVGKS